MYKLDIPLDLKEKAAIERRRRAEKERQGRVFNAKYRQTGVRINNLFFIQVINKYSLLSIQIDKEALDQQVQDRNWLEELEQKRANAFGKNPACFFYSKIK